MTVKKFNVQEEGLNHFFGSLEARIMDILWSSEAMTIGEVHEILNAEIPISFNAVMTVMNRLLEKDHLQKELRGSGRGRAFIFHPIQTRDQFLSEQTKAVTVGLIQEYGDLVVNHMVDALNDADPQLIAKLQDKLNHMSSRNKP
ncbi:MAG: BlaI/MecI/CopY family transcriptional regulator [Bacilli bacterium]